MAKGGQALLHRAVERAFQKRRQVETIKPKKKVDKVER